MDLDFSKFEGKQNYYFDKISPSFNPENYGEYKNDEEPEINGNFLKEHGIKQEKKNINAIFDKLKDGRNNGKYKNIINREKKLKKSEIIHIDKKDNYNEDFKNLLGENIKLHNENIEKKNKKEQFIFNNNIDKNNLKYTTLTNNLSSNTNNKLLFKKADTIIEEGNNNSFYNEFEKIPKIYIKKRFNSQNLPEGKYKIEKKEIEQNKNEEKKEELKENIIKNLNKNENTSETKSFTSNIKKKLYDGKNILSQSEITHLKKGLKNKRKKNFYLKIFRNKTLCDILERDSEDYYLNNSNLHLEKIEEINYNKSFINNLPNSNDNETMKEFEKQKQSIIKDILLDEERFDEKLNNYNNKNNNIIKSKKLKDRNLIKITKSKKKKTKKNNNNNNINNPNNNLNLNLKPIVLKKNFKFNFKNFGKKNLSKKKNKKIKKKTIKKHITDIPENFYVNESYWDYCNRIKNLNYKKIEYSEYVANKNKNLKKIPKFIINKNRLIEKSEDELEETRKQINQSLQKLNYHLINQNNNLKKSFSSKFIQSKNVRKKPKNSVENFKSEETILSDGETISKTFQKSGSNKKTISNLNINNNNMTNKNLSNEIINESNEFNIKSKNLSKNNMNNNLSFNNNINDDNNNENNPNLSAVKLKKFSNSARNISINNNLQNDSLNKYLFIKNRGTSNNLCFFNKKLKNNNNNNINNNFGWVYYKENKFLKNYLRNNLKNKQNSLLNSKSSSYFFETLLNNRRNSFSNQNNYLNLVNKNISHSEHLSPYKNIYFKDNNKEQKYTHSIYNNLLDKNLNKQKLKVKGAIGNNIIFSNGKKDFYSANNSISERGNTNSTSFYYACSKDHHHNNINNETQKIIEYPSIYQYFC